MTEILPLFIFSLLGSTGYRRNHSGQNFFRHILCEFHLMGTREGSVIGAWTCCIKIVFLSPTANAPTGGTGVNYGAFTGAHEVKFSEDIPEEIVPGMIVSVNGKTAARTDEDGNISLSSTLPTVTISTKPRDKAVFGSLFSKVLFTKNTGMMLKKVSGSGWSML
jgi:hypothetical protein